MKPYPVVETGQRLSLELESCLWDHIILIAPNTTTMNVSDL